MRESMGSRGGRGRGGTHDGAGPTGEHAWQERPEQVKVGEVVDADGADMRAGQRGEVHK